MSDRPSEAAKSYRNPKAPGEWVGLYRGLSDDAPWSLVCELHSTVLDCESAKFARSFVQPGGKIDPEWCEMCQSAEHLSSDACPPGCTVDHDAEQRAALAAELAASFNPESHALMSPRDRLIGWACEVPPPSIKELELHASKFGPDSVAEIAEAYGLEINLENVKLPAPPPKKVKPISKRRQAQQMVAEGTSWTVIEELLDLPRPLSKRWKDEMVDA